MNVLVVEDDASVMQLIERLLVEHGFGMCKASSGRGALELLRTEAVDIVILDLNLGPGVSGRDVAMHMLLESKESVRVIPIVVITGDAQERAQVEVNPLQLAVCRIDKGPNFSEQLVQTLEVIRAQIETQYGPTEPPP